MTARRDRQADAVATLFDRIPAGFALVFPDGCQVGPGPETARATILVRDSETLATLMAMPTLEQFGEAFIAGALDVEGDLVAALEAAYAMDALTPPPATGPVPRPPDDAAIRHHYDLPAEFFGLFLDRRMVYTCAYYRRRDATLDEAQEDKLDLVCRKLDLRPGDRFLDIGCGWGPLTGWAAERYGVDALGVTLSAAQAGWAKRMLAAATREPGVHRTGGEHRGRARVEHRDYRDVAGDGNFDEIAAVGIIEHVGVANYPAYFTHLHRLLRPGGLLLNHGITHATPGQHSTGMTFLTRHVFPGAEFERIGYVIARMEDAGFRILDVESLGGHYARTTASWLARLQANAQRAREIVGDRIVRTWIAYLAAATVAFRAGWIDLHQVLAERPDPAAPRRADTREHCYRARGPA